MFSNRLEIFVSISSFFCHTLEGPNKTFFLPSSKKKKEKNSSEIIPSQMSNENGHRCPSQADI